MRSEYLKIGFLLACSDILIFCSPICFLLSFFLSTHFQCLSGWPIFRNKYVYSYPYMHAVTILETRVNEFEGERRGASGKVWRKVRREMLQLHYILKYAIVFRKIIKFWIIVKDTFKLDSTWISNEYIDCVILCCHTCE